MRNLRNERGNSWDLTSIQVNINYWVYSFERKFVEKID